jgi:CHAT domain-containing protein
VLNKQNPLFSYVALRPGGEEDGRLEVHEVLNLSLHSRLVVLSACQTGLGSGALGDVPPGDDWVGLVQAFLYAGSAKVLATAWPIVDRATDPLMRGFYRRLQAGVTEDIALAMEQRAAIADPRLRHPRFWGPFMLTGGR